MYGVFPPLLRTSSWRGAKLSPKNNSYAIQSSGWRTREVSRRSRLDAGVSPRRPVFDPKSARVRFVVDKVALEQVFSPNTTVLLCRYHSTNALRDVAEGTCWFRSLVLPLLIRRLTKWPLSFLVAVRPSVCVTKWYCSTTWTKFYGHVVCKSRIKRIHNSSVVPVWPYDSPSKQP
jgi:hypothetical protein